MNGKKFLKLMFSLDEFVIPSIIRVLYILSFLFIILYSLYDAFGDIRYSFRSFSGSRKLRALPHIILTTRPTLHEIVLMAHGPIVTWPHVPKKP